MVPYDTGVAWLSLQLHSSAGIVGAEHPDMLPSLALSGALMCRLCELPVLPVESVVGAAGQAAAALRAVGRGRHAAPPAHQGVLKWLRSGLVTVKSHCETILHVHSVTRIMACRRPARHDVVTYCRHAQQTLL